MHLRFDCYGQCYSKVEGHPQEIMKELGISYQHATPQSMSDQWWFWNCKNIPTELPEFIDELKTDPMKCIGWGLNKEIAEKIRDYKQG